MAIVRIIRHDHAAVAREDLRLSVPDALALLGELRGRGWIEHRFPGDGLRICAPPPGVTVIYHFPNGEPYLPVYE